MSKIIEKISGITVLLLGVVSVALVALIYLGGNAESISVGEESLIVPKFTDSLLYWSYFLVFLTIAITILLTLYGFIKTLISSPVSAIKTLIPLIIFALVFVVGWYLGSGEKISIIGYEGTDNEGFWARFTDMIIYSIYALFIGLALTIAGSAIYKKLN
ncbi:MAG: hypothetical protein Q7U47_10940 [Paludibacter sp.]|nr:hypothetical protein [Paludibacter sp.]